jgi:predicted transcriptional regulator
LVFFHTRGLAETEKRDSVSGRFAAGPGYTSGMKTAVSIPDKLFRRAEELAKRLGKSRSQIYREALTEYVDRREPGAVTVALDQVVEELAPGVDEWLAEAGRSTLERSEW